MPKWNLTATEYELQQFNLRMNDKGIPIDTGFCEKALVMAENAKNRRDSKIIEMTDGEVQAATQRDKLLKYICEIWGVDLPDMQKATLERRLNDENLPEELKEIIALRLESAANNTRKYQSFLNMVCQDGRVHGAIQFRGAFRTGRDAARLVQPQNMIKPGMKWEDIESGIDAIKKGYYDLVCG
jgi:DNA polymerase